MGAGGGSREANCSSAACVYKATKRRQQIGNQPLRAVCTGDAARHTLLGLEASHQEITCAGKARQETPAARARSCFPLAALLAAPGGGPRAQPGSTRRPTPTGSWSLRVQWGGLVSASSAFTSNGMPW